jgi:LysM repeat protein
MRKHQDVERRRSVSEDTQRPVVGKQTLTDSLSADGDATAVKTMAEAGLSGGGGELPHRAALEAGFGTDLSSIRAHTGDRAASASRAIGAEAYTYGTDIAFTAADPSRELVAHEVAHAIQQRSGAAPASGVGRAGDEFEAEADQAARVVAGGGRSELAAKHAGGAASGAVQRKAVQRYEAGEHAKAGDTQQELKSVYAPVYTVAKGDTLASIADRFKVPASELKAANAKKLKKWPASDGSAKLVEGFEAGEEVTIPRQLDEMERDAIAGPTIKITINGVALDYGAVMAMGDMFGSIDELYLAPPEQLEQIAALIEEEKRTGNLVSAERWQDATNKRFGELATENEAHFAPSDASIGPVSGRSTGDHKQTWSDHHRMALAAARAGDKNRALAINAFGDHFLTDAFAAGHLFNKRDMMERVDAQLPTTGTGEDREFTNNAEQFFTGIATAVFQGEVRTAFSRYEAVETTLYVHPDIDSVTTFSILLQKIHLARPELLLSAVAKGPHDKLNTRPGGLLVENAYHQQWLLSGDKTLNEETLAMARRAVARSQQNVIDAFRAKAAADDAKLIELVWNLTPRLLPESRRDVASAVDAGGDMRRGELQAAIIELIRTEYPAIIEGLVDMNALRLIE